MKDKKTRQYNKPLSDSNLTEHEQMRSRFDPNGSYTGVPDGWDTVPTPDSLPDKRDVESGNDAWEEYPDVYSSGYHGKHSVGVNTDEWESGTNPDHTNEYPNKHKIEVGTDKYPDRYDIELGTDEWEAIEGTPTTPDGYPSIPDGEIPVWDAQTKQDITPVQDVDDL